MTAALAIVIGTGATSDLTEEGGVNESSSGSYGQQMSPLGRESYDRLSRKALSTSPPAVRSEKCPTARQGLRFYMRRANEWAHKMGAAAGRDAEPAQSPANRCPRYLANLWRSKSRAARLRYEHWKEQHTLRDFPFTPGGRAWHRAVEEAQKVFPGTEGWLLSCSSAEGGHGRWVGYAGVSYSESLRDSDTVGGPLQYRFSTFTGHFRRALDYAREHRYFVPRSLSDRTNAWTSALGQALAGGWARYTGNDDSHWSASWGRGC